ncbi:MAG: NAD-dependent epimerase/dehydratase family protein [Pirellulales bacterium]
MSKRILVTGYGGFLGRAICRWLLERGYRVRGVARQEYPQLAEMGVECIQGNLCDRATVGRACQQVDGVIHTAALAGIWGPARSYESINVDATRLLMEESKRQGVSAFVHCSSPSVTFDGKPQSGVDESVPYPSHFLCHYPRTKAIAEKFVLDQNSPGQILTCALRPHLIWGEGDPHLFPRVISKCRQGKLKRVGSGRNLIDTVHVDLAALGHGLALEKLLQGDAEVAGRAFFLTDGVPVECWEWIGQILALEGLKPPRSSVPLPVAYAAGWMLEKIYSGLRIQKEPPMTRFVALQLGVDHYFSIESARKRLGYEPKLDRAKVLEGLRGKFGGAHEG